ncbi:BadF/BadG/BcrA/BcrD ATPase family protein [Halioxenophilus sp. WMMB6]|uniref:BadF/BadG/BcrA/BcrD ATPase family protein n=1 Tax=Halioxenophilus sp. WMMB6 TaxID=3073815 RepID=UPI00295E4838|nr:BadF/BadG/BcrA/BcrD ATPase family protein [Halioxenophilus sp. WMMB6]
MYFLGIDGGGSNCRARLESATGELLGFGQAGPANVASNPEVAKANILAATADAVASANITPAEHLPIHAVLGLAGYNLAAGRVAMAEWRSPFANTFVTSDMHIACAGAHAGQDGAIMIVGTGSSAILCLGEQLQEVGGYGLPLGDQASGAEMGLTAVQLVLQCLDGLLPTTSLVQRVLQQVAVTSATELAEIFHKAKPVDFARLAPVVVELARSGDPHAEAIVAKAISYMTRMISHLQQAGAPRISLVGGLAEVLAAFLPEELQAKLAAAAMSPVEGAALLAREKFATP